ncbi:4-hydroxy-3-methylbut-2-en-1-yl diphosphate synthase (flavodoxin) [Geodia barretti]|uniref:4-hydroxy-3-methylbut-2-en-1-yl diphosphate synthase (Flavodoxin) n=1 Tax=Geodia barretti TaxID=519541 RepID=A0AA35W9B6_GEOBA|nr:4-hydroxy-3-methylbut-2-en-1-yl diphosphate synthase (flavodoxin) [Geodia barretti]
MIKRRPTKPVYVGGVKVGGDAEITVQSMTKTDTRDVAATVRQIHELEEAGCDIIRSAVPDMDAAIAMGEIKKQINIPLIADIHFHYQLALKCLEGGNVPIRIGVNFGSLPPVGGIGRTRGFSRHMDLVNKLPKADEANEGDYSAVDHMVATALWEISLLEEQDFDQIKISMKAFDVPTTVEAYARLAEMVPYPLHLGINRGGHQDVRGIGDTIRVSLSDDSVDEVIAGYEILKSLNLRSKGAVLVACPSCGRADVDVRKLANDVDALLRKSNRNIKVAVMGCEVNGPGEAKDADVGIAAGAGRAVIFRKGEKVRVVPEADMLTALMEEVEAEPEPAD